MNLKQTATEVVAAAIKQGASAAEAVVRDGSEFSTLVRMGEVETLKEAGSKAIGLRVFLGQRAASTYSSDFSREGLETLVSSAVTLAKITSEDPHAGLPEKFQLGSIPGDLDLFYSDVYSLSTAERIEYARRAALALAKSQPRASLSSSTSRLRANSSARSSTRSLATPSIAAPLFSRANWESRSQARTSPSSTTEPSLAASEHRRLMARAF